MIDWLKIRIPVKHQPLTASGWLMCLDEHGDVEWMKAARTVVGSDINDRASSDHRISLQSTGALDENGHCEELTIDGNLIKFFQGHNLWGTDDHISLTHAFLWWLKNADPSKTVKFISETLPSPTEWIIQRIDITHYIDTGSRHNVRCFLDAIAEDGHTKFQRANYTKGTVYLNKTSRRWGVKFYDKYTESKNRGKGHRIGFSYWKPYETTPLERSIEDIERLQDSVINLVRCELVLRQNELREIECKSATNLNPTKLFIDYVSRIKTESTMRITDQKVHELPQAVKGTYLLWSQGHDVRSVLSKATYYRHKKNLESVGIDISRNCSERKTATVVDLTRFLTTVKAATFPASLTEHVFDPSHVYRSA